MSQEHVEMQCRELVGLVTDYLEETLAEVEAERVEEHMADCEWCERYVDQTRQVIAALGRLGEQEGEAADAAAWSTALEAFRSARAGKEPGP